MGAPLRARRYGPPLSLPIGAILDVEKGPVAVDDCAPATLRPGKVRIITTDGCSSLCEASEVSEGVVHADDGSGGSRRGERAHQSLLFCHVPT